MYATLISNAVLLTGTTLIHLGVPRSILLMTFFTDIILIGGVRLLYRLLRRLSCFGFFTTCGWKRVLIVGGGDAGSIIIKELKLNLQLKSIPVAIIDDDRFKRGRKINGVTIIGDRYCIASTVENYKIDEIIIALPSAPKVEINKIFSECSRTSCKVKILPSVSQLIEGSVCIQKIREVKLEDLLGREPIKLDTCEISSYIKDHVVLVTGGGGSIGSELCRQISSFEPKRLIILDNYENNAYDIQNELTDNYPNLDLFTVIANIRDKQRLENIFRKYRPEVVFHAAAHKHVPLMEANPTEAIKNNVFGTQNVAECADKYEVIKFVLISTDKAVNPTNIMGATKRIAEMMVQSFNRHSKTEFVAVRFGNVLGSNGSVIPLFKKQIEKGGPVTVTHPEVTRYFMTITEAAQLVIQAGAMAKGGEIFVLDMGQPVKIVDLARNLIKLSGFDPDEEIKIEFTGLRSGEKLYEELLLDEEGLQTTNNDKIFIAPPVFTDLESLKKEISILNEIIVKSSDEVVKYVPKIVPTYKVAL
jgi:FlaA1/EpsC-like NDP-sugar epimerase